MTPIQLRKKILAVAFDKANKDEAIELVVDALWLSSLDADDLGGAILEGITRDQLRAIQQLQYLEE